MIALELVEATTRITAVIANRADDAADNPRENVSMSYVFAAFDPSAATWVVETAPVSVTIRNERGDFSYNVPAPATRPFLAPDLEASHERFRFHREFEDSPYVMLAESNYCKIHDLFDCWLNH